MKHEIKAEIKIPDGYERVLTGYIELGDLILDRQQMVWEKPLFDYSVESVFIIRPIHGWIDKKYGFELAMRVLQSDLYRQLDDLEKQQCDTLCYIPQPKVEYED